MVGHAAACKIHHRRRSDVRTILRVLLIGRLCSTRHIAARVVVAGCFSVKKHIGIKYIGSDHDKRLAVSFRLLAYN